MIKKIFLLLCLSFLFACNNKEPKTTLSVDNKEKKIEVSFSSIIDGDEQTEDSELTEAQDDFYLVGLISGMQKEEVLKLHGKPGNIEKDNEDVTGKAYFWNYNGFKVYLYNDVVSIVYLTDSRYQTKRGISVGNPKNWVLNLYKDAKYIESKSENGTAIILYSYSITVANEQVPCGFCIYRIIFQCENDIITKISSSIDCCPRS